jgi:hypothetical protein
VAVCAGVASKITGVLYSTLAEGGTEPIACVGQSFEMKDLINISLKSISLLTPDEIVRVFSKDPKQIIQHENVFGIIPYPDMGMLGLSYLFRYSGMDDNTICCTLTVLVMQKDKNFLFDKHDIIEKMLKFTAFEILKVVIKGGDDPEIVMGSINEQLTNLKEKLDLF